MSKLHSIRSWYTLGDAVRRLGYKLGEQVQVDDLLNVLAEQRVLLHFRGAGGVAAARRVRKSCAWPCSAAARVIQHHFQVIDEKVYYLHGPLPIEFVSIVAGAYTIGLCPSMGNGGTIFGGAAWEDGGKISITPGIVVCGVDEALFQILSIDLDGRDMRPLAPHVSGLELLIESEKLQAIEDQITAQNVVQPTTTVSQGDAAALIERRHQEQAAELETNGAGRPVSRQEFQEDLILTTLRQLGYDPQAIPPSSPTAPGAKAAARDAIGTQFTRKVFDFAWERLRKDGRLANRDGVSL